MTEVASRGSSLGAVVLSGGRSRRLGEDKAATVVAGRSLLDHALDALPAEAFVVCVGPRIATTRAVHWTREQPPYGGPLAGVEAGLETLPPEQKRVLIIGADMPHAGPGVAALLAASPVSWGAEVVAVRDGEGRLQPLLSLWPRQILAQRMMDLAPTRGRALAALLDGVPMTVLADDWGASRDVDTRDELDAFRVERKDTQAD